MSQPVKLSDTLVLDARLAGEIEKRSIAGQVEYWASLGKLIDALIDGRTRTDALQRSGARPLSELVATIGTPEGDARLKAYLESEPFPHFEAHPNRKGVLIRIEADGTRSVGRFVDREFVVESDPEEELAPLAVADLAQLLGKTMFRPVVPVKDSKPVSPIEAVNRLMAKSGAVESKRTSERGRVGYNLTPKGATDKSRLSAATKRK